MPFGAYSVILAKKRLPSSESISRLYLFAHVLDGTNLPAGLPYVICP